MPLHGVRNKGGKGEAVKVLAYEVPLDRRGDWAYSVLDQTMHLTHNFEAKFSEKTSPTMLFIGGKEGIRLVNGNIKAWIEGGGWIWRDHSFGEVRWGRGPKGRFLAGIEPMHGNVLSMISLDMERTRTVVTEDLKQGHALACADLLGQGHHQIVVGWREANEAGKVGIRMYVLEEEGTHKMYVIDDNEMACEDLKVADLNADGKLDIIACGRATQNLKVYWNHSK